MKRKMFCVLALLVFVITILPISTFAAGKSIQPLKVTRKLPEIKPISNIEPYSQYWFPGMDVISGDLSSSLDLANSLTFSDVAVFPSEEKLPAGFNPQALLEWGKNPGLNIDILHKHGFTGKEAVIAYIDQPFSSNAEYDNANIHYVNNSNKVTEMHGPAVISLLVGKDIGTAPEAEVYYYAHESWKADQATHAECLYQMIEQNKQLPEDKKITMVGFSDNIDPREKNEKAFRDAVAACEKEGIMVWFCGEYGSAAFLPYSDKNNENNVVRSAWVSENAHAQLVYVPTSGRTTAATFGNSSYIYWSDGGLSWTMPYMLGLYAIAIEIDPTLTQNEIRTLVKKTAYKSNGLEIINPVGFISKVLQGVGRNTEADALLKDVAANTRYSYAVVNKTALNKNDLSAIEKYLSNITDSTVLIVDASSYKNSKTLYTALQNDAVKRGGIITGIQIFGTADMVPSFQVNYKVQMVNGIDEGGQFLTDLFYGNFDNDAGKISTGYNVMDHFAENWNVELIPHWPVARLPLEKGQYTAFFKKYDNFIAEYGFDQLDLVNFSNPIFKQTTHIDDMGIFLNRMYHEFNLINSNYRLYGNQDGQYPVTTKVLGNFTKENLSIENDKGVMELLINSHGQQNNIDQSIFQNNQEQRISLINQNNINSVLDGKPYYLDCWTCNNGYGMKDNLTTTALNGQCIGAFSATTIISNNGVQCNASLEDMCNSNFYYFYYHYLKAIHEGKSRSQAFFLAQQEYGKALIKNSQNEIRMEGNYQFNLYNLLAYHNFGLLESTVVTKSIY